MQDIIVQFINLTNETLAAAIVVVAASMLLYNLSRNWRNNIARTSSALLGAVTIAYVGDVFLSLEPSPDVAEAFMRLQWIGVALFPATLFHLSDALLATTGLPSRGRRRNIARLLYGISMIFILSATFGNALVYPVTFEEGIILRAGPAFVIYIAFFIVVNVTAFINVDRARRRCMTNRTRQRMTWLEFALITPVIGMFPYSLLLTPGDEFSLGAVLLVIMANLGVTFMLIFLSYPLSFFGSQTPDSVVKAELLRFMLRGPALGMIILSVIIFIRPATDVIGFSSDQFLPFAVVAVVLFWQWMTDLWLPFLERKLIYPKEEEANLAKIQTLSLHLLTHHDLTQHLEDIVEATCNYLRIETAFIIALSDHKLDLVSCTPNLSFSQEDLSEEFDMIYTMSFSDNGELHALPWHEYRLLPLFSRRIVADLDDDADDNYDLIGVFGLGGDNISEEGFDLSPDDRQQLAYLRKRAARSLDDMILQSEIYAALEGLLPQLSARPTRAQEIEFKPGRDGSASFSAQLPARDKVIEQTGAALRHYYGGPGLAKSRLLELSIVQDALEENDNNAIRALRAVLDIAIANQRPEGEQSMRSQEWVLYNILDLRFIKKRKVRDTARSLYISEANLYRKQNMAIEAVADTLIAMEEQNLLEGDAITEN